MFGNLLGSKFSNKCKHAFKCIKSRIGLIRRKKQAMLKYLKKDVAELLSNGHDTNAFGRIDSLMAEINHASCYDMIERYCECILQQLPSLQKQRECPEEAMEAMSTLIFAAARFSDLPELCDLRGVFTKRYGSQMESSISREFVDKVQKKKFSTEKRLQLMQYIADEFSVSWDSTVFLQKLSNPSAAPASDQPQRRSEISDQLSHAETWGNAAVMGRKEAAVDAGCYQEVRCKERWEPPRRSLVQKEQMQPKPRDIHVVPSIDNTKKVHAAAEGPENLEPRYKDDVSPMAKEGSGLVGVENANILPSDKPSKTEEELNSIGLINRMPPYTKPNFKNPSAADEGVKLASVPTDGSTRAGSNVSNGGDKPKPFSVRKKHPKPYRGADRQPQRDSDGDEMSMKRHESDQSGHRSRRYAAYDGDRDEEEEAMDRLLVHYSRKGMSNEPEPGNTRTSARATVRTVPAELVRRRLDRIASLPSEPTTPAAEAGEGKRHARAASMSSPKGGVVHPRLPDYDELAARFIALRKA